VNPVSAVSGRAVPLDRSDVDTDQIIPSDWLKKVERTGFGAGLFAEWRDERDFVLNKAEHAGATILVAGPNFGTGSSREHAVWALLDYGFKAVISPRFGDIFRNNSTKAGLVPVQVSEEVGRALLEAVSAEPDLEITVDIDRLIVSASRPPSLSTSSPATACSTASTTSVSPCATARTSTTTSRPAPPGSPLWAKRPVN
jgi:3-isopropylmalate/(R)-2-methylmalate dehydratase small subunit